LDWLLDVPNIELRAVQESTPVFCVCKRTTAWHTLCPGKRGADLQSPPPRLCCCRAATGGGGYGKLSFNLALWICPLEGCDTGICDLCTGELEVAEIRVLEFCKTLKPGISNLGVN